MGIREYGIMLAVGKTLIIMTPNRIMLDSDPPELAGDRRIMGGIRSIMLEFDPSELTDDSTQIGPGRGSCEQQTGEGTDQATPFDERGW